MFLPEGKFGLNLTHNGHKTEYKSLEEYLVMCCVEEDDWANPEERERALETDELWELQWHPHSPGGFQYVLGSTLEAVLAKAEEIEKEEGRA